MEALVIFLVILNNIVWMMFLFIMTPQRPSISIKVPKIKDLLPSAITKLMEKTKDDVVDIMNASPEDFAEINKSMKEEKK